MSPRIILAASLISLAVTYPSPDLSAQIPALAPEGLEGTVHEDGSPLFGTVLMLVASDGSSGLEITDREGRFRFGQVKPGDYRLSVRRAAYVLNGVDGVPWFGDEVPVSFRSGHRRISLSVARGGVIEGVVTDSFGNVLPGATVTVTRKHIEAPDGRREAGASFTTDGDGRYRAFGLRSGDYLVQAITRTSMGSGPLQLVERGVFEGITTSLARGVSTPTPTAASAQTQPVEYLPTYFGDAVAEAGATSVTVTAGRETSPVDIRLQLSASVTLRGTLLSSDGRALRNGRLYLFPIGSAVQPPGLVSIPVDETGRFERARVTPGQYRLVAYSSPSSGDGLESGLLDIRVPGAESSDLQVVTSKTRSLRGSLQVLDSLDQAEEPLAGFRVSLERVDQATVRTSFDRHEATTDRAGLFTISAIPAGEYRVSVVPPPVLPGRVAAPRLEFVEVRGERRLDRIVAILPGTDENIDVVLAREQADLIGTVHGSSLPPGLSVFLFPADPALRGSPDRVRLARIDPSAHYEILGVPEGVYFAALVAGLDLNELLTVATFDHAVTMARPVTLKRGERGRLDFEIAVP